VNGGELAPSGPRGPSAGGQGGIYPPVGFQGASPLHAVGPDRELASVGRPCGGSTGGPQGLLPSLLDEG